MSYTLPSRIHPTRTLPGRVPQSDLVRAFAADELGEKVYTEDSAIKRMGPALACDVLETIKADFYQPLLNFQQFWKDTCKPGEKMDARQTDSRIMMSILAAVDPVAGPSERYQHAKVVGVLAVCGLQAGPAAFPLELVQAMNVAAHDVKDWGAAESAERAARIIFGPDVPLPFEGQVLQRVMRDMQRLQKGLAQRTGPRVG
ncbi:MAG: hypothetical protein AB7G06_02950 [Bdellovibrionales bacterium]